MYRVIVQFSDVKDNGYIYEAGDVYPREGGKTTKARLAELASKKNAAGVPLIKEEKPAE